MRPFLLAFFATIAQAQTWTTITNAPPSGVTNCMLLTDGGVMCQSGAAWYKLTPNANGSYQNGTWSALASLPSGYNPDAYATAVMANGQLVVVGGEYNNGSFALSNMGAVYDPKANTWTVLTPPTTGAPNNFQCIGDAPSVVLADGRLLIGAKLFQNLAVLDPATYSWSIVSEAGKNDTFNSEEGWTLLPDGSVFTLDVSKAPAAERFLLTGPDTGTWISAGSTLQDLHTPTDSSPLQAPGCPLYYPPGEMGPALLRPDGTVFAIGASGYTGIYTPPTAGSTATGAWAVGPAMPSGLNVEDGPAALLPSGHVLFGGSPGDSGTGLKYFEFDGTNLISVPAPANAANDATYYTQLLVLPTGQALFIDGSTLVQLYNPAASPTYNPAWAPTIGSVSPTLLAGNTYEITGTQFNGLSAGTAFGDESENATNYPLVRISNNATGHIFYARTHDHSSMGVATGSTPVFTNFDVPANIEVGPSTLEVVANGIPSTAVAVTVVSNEPIITTGTEPTTLTAGSNSLTFNVVNGGTLAAPVIFTEGVPSSSLTNPDFTLSANGTSCSGSVSGTSCTVVVQFTPQFAGLRRGAVKIFDANNNLLATAFVYGVGSGAQKTLAAASLKTIASGGSPRSVAVDGAGDVFYVDNHAAQIYKIAPGGTAVAVALGLTLNSPFGIAIDAAGNLYIGDTGNNRIVKLPYGSSTATPLTLSGIDFPEAVAVDGSGNLFIANTRGAATTGSGNVVEVTSSGVQSTLIAAGLGYPAAVAVDAAGDVFFADWNNNRVVELPAGGGVSRSIGSGLSHASAVAVDAAGDVFIADENNNRVVEVPATTSGPGTGIQVVVASGLSTPYGLSFDGQGDLFIGNIGSNNATSGSILEIPISLLAQSITFGTIATQTVGTPLTLTATASSTLPVSYSSSTTNVCTVAGNTATFLGGGTCTIVASQAGNKVYAAATPVSQSFTVNPVVITTPVSVSLSSAFNVHGVFSNGTAPTNGGLDGHSYAYSSSLLGTSVSWSSVPFTIGASGVADAVYGATITLPAGSYPTLKLLATGLNGEQTGQTFVVTYTDGTTSIFVQSLSDWGTESSISGEAIAATLSYRLTPSGGTQNGPWHLYGYSFTLNTAKTVKSITLPNNRNVVVVAITL
jgi:streptogramin lyase